MDLGAFNRHTMHPVSHYISCVYNIYPHILIVSPYEENKRIMRSDSETQRKETTSLF
jgi:hypothetical protein